MPGRCGHPERCWMSWSPTFAPCPVTRIVSVVQGYGGRCLQVLGPAWTLRCPARSLRSCGGVSSAAGHTGDELAELLTVAVPLPGLVRREVQILDGDRQVVPLRPVQEPDECVPHLGVTVLCGAGQVVPGCLSTRANPYYVCPSRTLEPRGVIRGYAAVVDPEAERRQATTDGSRQHRQDHPSDPGRTRTRRLDLGHHRQPAPTRNLKRPGAPAGDHRQNPAAPKFTAHRA